MIRLEGPKIYVTCGNREVSYYRLSQALRALPPQVVGELLDALDREIRLLLRPPPVEK